MEHGGEGVLSYPLSSPAALDPPVEWDRLRRDCPVAPITFPSGDVGSLLTRYDELVKLEGLIVGGLTEVPVRW